MNILLEGYVDDVSNIISHAIAGVAIIHNGTGLQKSVRISIISKSKYFVK